MKDMAEGKVQFDGHQAEFLMLDCLKTCMAMIEMIRLVRRVKASEQLYKIQMVVSKDMRNLAALLVRFLDVTVKIVNGTEKSASFDKTYSPCVSAASTLKTSVIRLKWEDAALWDFTVKKY